MRLRLGPSGRRRAVVAVVAGGVVAALACSAIVEHADAQCTTNTDCARFPRTVCMQDGVHARGLRGV
jgi:hypothetical protein